MNRCKLGDLLKIKQGYAFKSENYISCGNYILCTLGNFSSNNSFKFDAKKATYYPENFPKEFILRENDLVIPLTEQVVGLFGNTAFIPKTCGYCFVLNQRVGKVNPIAENADKIFLHYLLSTEGVRNQIEATASGTKQRNTSPDKIYDVTVWVPEKREQITIGQALHNLELKIELNNKINAELETLAKTIYDYWFVQFEFPDEHGKPYKSAGGKMTYNEKLKRDVPVGWEVKFVEDFCRIFTGKKDVNQALNAGKYKFFSCAPTYRFSNEKLFDGEAILISGNGSYTGRTIFINEAFDLYQRTYACVNKDDCKNLIYIFYSMLRNFVERVGGGTHGSAIPYIVYDDIAKESILYEENIAFKFDNIIRPVQNNIISNAKENEKLIALRDWLLPMLVNGQVQVG